MAKHYQSAPSRDARVCLLSARQVRDRVTDAYIYELEDIICDVDAVDLITYSKPPDLARKVYTLTSQITRSSQLANLITPTFETPYALDKDYDLLIVVFRNIFEILSIKSIKNWRQRCKKAVCYMIESWNNPHWLHNRMALLETLKEFDHIFLGVHNSVDAIANYTQRPCSHLVYGVDTIRFCPYPSAPNRCIDITSLGRRSTVTHQALLEQAAQGNLFYYYDTGSNLRMINPQEHRFMNANLLKRSRYFVTNCAAADEPEKIGVGHEIGYRFFEGAAAGTVMIGMPPATELFNQYFGWPDAVIPMPYDAPAVAEVIAELDAQPERLAAIRRNSVVASLLQNDWVYRWRDVLSVVGLDALPNTSLREAKLQSLADWVKRGQDMDIPSASLTVA
jgi:hypothetical protein